MIKQIIIFITLIVLIISCDDTKEEINYNHFPVSSQFVIPENDKLTINYPPSDFKPYSGTVSHHLLVGYLINEWFSSLKKLRPDITTFIILSPRHTDISKDVISTTASDFNHEKYRVKNNRKYSKLIQESLKLKNNNKAFIYEHGISSLLPFISTYFPNAEITPVLLDENHRQNRLCINISESISRIMKEDDNCFILISIDFSHRVDLEQTLKRDKKTEKVLSSGDFTKINDIYSDNNGSLYVLSEFLILHKYFKSHVFSYTNSEIFGNKDKNDVTSYFFTFQTIN